MSQNGPLVFGILELFCTFCRLLKSFLHSPRGPFDLFWYFYLYPCYNLKKYLLMLQSLPFKCEIPGRLQTGRIIYIAGIPLGGNGYVTSTCLCKIVLKLLQVVYNGTNSSTANEKKVFLLSLRVETSF